MKLVGWFSVALLSLVLASGCSSKKSDPSSEAQEVRPDDVSGAWTWTLDPLACSILDGFLNANDNLPNEVFNVFQNGGDIDSDFFDSVGNQISIRGSITGNGIVNGTITITEPSPAQVTGPVVAECEALAFLSNSQGSAIHVVDMRNLTTILNHGNLGEPRRSCASRDGSRVYVPDSSLNRIYVLEGSTGLLLATLTGGSTPILSPTCCAVSPDGGTLYVGTHATATTESAVGLVFEVDIATNTVTDTIFTDGLEAVDMDLSSDGSLLYVVSSEIPVLDTIDTGIGSSVSSIFLELTPTACDLTPDDSTMIITVLGMSQIMRSSVAGTEGLRLVFLDGTDVVVNSTGDRAYVSLGVDGGGFPGQTQLSGGTTVPLAREFETTAFSPLGDYAGPDYYSWCVGICPDDGDILVGSAESLPTLHYRIENSFVQTTLPGVSSRFITIVEGGEPPPEPRTIVLEFNGIARFNENGRMLDGDFQVLDDNGPTSNSCVGQNFSFWAFIGQFLD